MVETSVRVACSECRGGGALVTGFADPSVPGLVVNRLHRHHDASGGVLPSESWTVTHRRSGFVVGNVGFLERAQALAVVTALGRLADWRLPYGSLRDPGLSAAIGRVLDGDGGLRV